MSCGVGYRHSLDPALLWYRPEAVAPIQPLASWELPYATDAALKSPKIKTKNEKKKRKIKRSNFKGLFVLSIIAYFKKAVLQTAYLVPPVNHVSWYSFIP